MDESVVRYLGQKRLRLSEAIRIGIPHVKEDRSYFGCALACAFYAVRSTTRWDGPALWLAPDCAARYFGVPLKVVERASLFHYRGQKTRGQIADWLEAKGY